MRVCLMIAGQEDVTWDQWIRIARACEDAGLEGLFRSDHYLSVTGRTQRGSLDAWATLAALADRTERIRLGTLVSPVTFRHPSVLARMVTTVDHISGGRAELGIGAGWLEDEHRAFGFHFPETRERMSILSEQIEIVVRQWTDPGFDFHGAHYRLESSDALPKPVQRPHPPVIVGGAANPTSARLAARWADEYNTVFASPQRCRERRALVERALEREGRDPGELVFSLMTGIVVGTDDDDVAARARAVMEREGAGGDPHGWMEGRTTEWVIGTVEQVVDRLGELEDAGVDRVMLQHLAHDDLETIALLGSEVVPRVAGPA